MCIRDSTMADFVDLVLPVCSKLDVYKRQVYVVVEE